MWLFPVAFFFSIFLPGFGTHPGGYFFFLIMPVFFGCFWFASKPVREKQMSKSYAVVWTVLAPFGIWVIVVGGFWSLVFLATWHDS